MSPGVVRTSSRAAGEPALPLLAPGGGSLRWVDWPRGPVFLVVLVFAAGAACYLSLPLFWQDACYQFLGMLACWWPA